ncbi:MAG: VCBS repeat-containing protein [Planctomycetes bacterium]|nr:VCBS repeat-containing protein [Planctomycetota bacterium]
MRRLTLCSLLVLALASLATAQNPVAIIGPLGGIGPLSGGTPGTFGNATARVSAALDLVIADAGYDAPGATGIDIGVVHYLDGPITQNILASLYGQSAGDEFGFRVVALDDVNQDGIAEVAISAPGGGYVQLVDLVNGTLATISAPAGATAFGRGLARVSDLNGDGVADLVVAAVNVLHFHDGATGAPIASATTICDSLVPGGPITLAPYDYDLDGFLDVAIANPANGLIDVIDGDPSSGFGILASYFGAPASGFGAAMTLTYDSAGAAETLVVGAPLADQAVILKAQNLGYLATRTGAAGSGFGGSLATVGANRDELIGIDQTLPAAPLGCLLFDVNGARRSVIDNWAFPLSMVDRVEAFGDFLGGTEVEFLVRLAGGPGVTDLVVFYQGAPPASTTSIGAGAAPVGLPVPQLAVAQSGPYFGNAAFAFLVNSMVNGSNASLLLGIPMAATPIPGQPANFQLFVNPVLGSIPFQFNGPVFVPLPIGNDPVFSGLVLRAQAAGISPQGELQLSQAIEFVIGYRP